MLNFKKFNHEFSQYNLIGNGIDPHGAKTLRRILFKVFHFFLDERQCQIASHDWWISKFAKQNWSSANMIKMTMRKNHSANIFFPTLEATDIRNDVVNSGHIFF